MSDDNFRMIFAHLQLQMGEHPARVISKFLGFGYKYVISNKCDNCFIYAP